MSFLFLYLSESASCPEKASEANVPKPNVGVAQSRINIANGPTRFSSSDNARLNHVADRHSNPNKNTVNIPVKEIPGGQYKRIVDTGEIIGNTALKHGGKPTSWIEIYTDKSGNLITTYPIPKP